MGPNVEEHLPRAFAEQLLTEPGPNRPGRQLIAFVFGKFAAVILRDFGVGTIVHSTSCTHQLPTNATTL